MKFGVFDHVDRREAPIHELFEERLKLAAACDEAGFYAYHIAEHHMTRLGMAPSPNVFLAAISQRTKRIKIGALVHLLPLYNPLRLLEEIGMLDNISNGRFQLGLGRGISPYEVGYFGVTPQESRVLYEEVIEILLRGMQNDVLNYESERFKYYDVPMEQRPMQQPYPPLWIGAHHNSSLDFGAKHGCNVVIGGPNALVREATDYYPEAWEKYKASPVRKNSPVTSPLVAGWRFVYLAESEDEAVKIAAPAFKMHMENLASLWRRWGGIPGIYLKDWDEAVASQVYIAGTPEMVRERLAGDIDFMGVNYMIFSLCWGSISHEQSMRSLELFRTEVMAHFVSGEDQAAA